MNVRILYIIIFNFIQVVSAQDESVFQKKSIYDICCWGSTIGNINYYHLNTQIQGKRIYMILPTRNEKAREQECTISISRKIEINKEISFFYFLNRKSRRFSLLLVCRRKLEKV